MESTMLPRPHDLLEVDVKLSLMSLVQQGAPAWVADILELAPWLTVRRAPASANCIPAGVRGLRRDQRWACYAHSSQIKRIVRPWEIPVAETLQTWCTEAPVPAMEALANLHAHWDAGGYCWGPYGSVAFELMTGAKCTTEESDLDLVIDGSRPMSRDTARILCQGLATQLIRVDALVETPRCGFWLREFADSGENAPILLRTPNGARLGSDPWGESL